MRPEVCHTLFTVASQANQPKKTHTQSDFHIQSKSSICFVSDFRNFKINTNKKIQLLKIAAIQSSLCCVFV